MWNWPPHDASQPGPLGNDMHETARQVSSDLTSRLALKLGTRNPAFLDHLSLHAAPFAANVRGGSPGRAPPPPAANQVGYCCGRRPIRLPWAAPGFGRAAARRRGIAGAGSWPPPLPAADRSPGAGALQGLPPAQRAVRQRRRDRAHPVRPPEEGIHARECGQCRHAWPAAPLASAHQPQPAASHNPLPLPPLPQAEYDQLKKPKLLGGATIGDELGA